MTTESDIALSREYEMSMYLQSMSGMYEDALIQNGEVYDIALRLTHEFSRISEAAVLEDSRIIKTLRYAVAPTISQMKFGQLFGLSSTDKLEAKKVAIGSSQYSTLARTAASIAQFATDHLDRSRFIWLDGGGQRSTLALSYAKKWTCSLAADQNAQTAYRNWRKAQQEQAIVATLTKMGFAKSACRGIVCKYTDIAPGEYTQEIKIKGRTLQKADIAFRSRRSGRLVLIEAKAVGVELDATKRIKECCDKASDWKSASELEAPQVVAVIAGFFTASNLSNLEASGIHIVWEHALNDLEKYT